MAGSGAFVVPLLGIVSGAGDRRLTAARAGRILGNQQSKAMAIDILVVVDYDTANRAKRPLRERVPESTVSRAATAPVVPDRAEGWGHNGEEFAVTAAAAAWDGVDTRKACDVGHGDYVYLGGCVKQEY
jgi:superfamily II DNA or RNA helicase